MAEWHINDIKNFLEQKRFTLIRTLPGDDYRTAGSIEFKRGIGISIILDFVGLDDLTTLPIEESYACVVRDTDISIYLRKKRNERWKKELKEFIEKINSL